MDYAAGIKFGEFHQKRGYYLHHHIHVIELVIQMSSQHEGLEVFIEPARLLQPIIQICGGILLMDRDHHLLCNKIIIKSL